MPMSSHGRELFSSLLDQNRPWGFWAEYKEKDKMLEGQTAHGNGAGSYKYSEKGTKIDFGT